MTSFIKFHQSLSKFLLQPFCSCSFSHIEHISVHKINSGSTFSHLYVVPKRSTTLYFLHPSVSCNVCCPGWKLAVKLGCEQQSIVLVADTSSPSLLFCWRLEKHWSVYKYWSCVCHCSLQLVLIYWLHRRTHRDALNLSVRSLVCRRGMHCNWFLAMLCVWRQDSAYFIT